MFNRCCVVGCDSRRKSVKLFQFPKTEIGLLTQLLKCVSGGEQKSINELRKMYVCEKHFEKRFITAKSRLRMGAYPTLFTANEIASGLPDVPKVTWDTENYNPNIDHGYYKIQHYDHNYCKGDKTITVSETNIEASHSHSQETITSITTDVEEPLPSTSGLGHTSSTSVVEYPVITTPRQYRSRKRLVHNTTNLTPNCRKLYIEYRKSRKQLEFSKRARKAISFSKEKSFRYLTEKMTPMARKILWMQIKQSEKKQKGRRFTREEKLISLSIMKQSPKCYSFLQKIFILPSKQTLNKFISEINIEAGINTHIFAAIKREVHTWDKNRKYCSILFDEVALESGLSYNKNMDYIDGFVELQNKCSDFADHALVFMLRGAVCKWQQPVAFYFCKGATAAIHLKIIIKKIIEAVIQTDLIPVALVSDQGTAFQAALKSLLEECKRAQILSGDVIDDVIIINKHRLSVVYDPPHLLKGLRNNFLNKHIKFDNKLCKWSDIVEVYKTDCKHAQMRLLHKLNDEHVIPEKIKKMKVKNCARVFSKTMAATLSYTAQFSNYSDGTTVSPTLKNTAEVVSFFDDLFDSVNGACPAGKKNKGKALRTVVTKTSPHHEFWKQSIIKLQNMRYYDKGKEIYVPSQKNWIITLRSYIRLWQFFDSKNIKIIRPRYFNSDPLENFFGQVRAYNYRYNNPDCHSFKCTFRSLLITRFIKFHSESFNCEEDSAEQLLKLQSLFGTGNNQRELNADNAFEDDLFPISSAESSVAQGFNPEIFRLEANMERLNVHSQAYTAGWVIRKILKNIKCCTCESILTTNETHTIHKWISIREYKSIVNNHKLTYPSEQSVRLFRYITKETIAYLEKQPHKNNILKEIKNIIKSKYSMDFLACETHNIHEYFLDYTLTLTIFNWCNTINKILKGTDISRIDSNKLPPMQLKAFVKYKKKLKNKRMNK